MSAIIDQIDYYGDGEMLRDRTPEERDAEWWEAILRWIDADEKTA